jgi:hypothetical protein
MSTGFHRLRSQMKRPRRAAVTLVIYGWRESEPGTLAWVFPSLQAALRAVRAMRNAISWLIVKGRKSFDGEFDLNALRAAGAILVESAA